MQRSILIGILCFLIGWFAAFHSSTEIESDPEEVLVSQADEVKTISSVDAQPEYTVRMEERVYAGDSLRGSPQFIQQCDLTSISQLLNQRKISLFDNFTRIFPHSAYTRPRELLYNALEAVTLHISNIVLIDWNYTSTCATSGGRSPFARARSPGLHKLSMTCDS